MKVRAFIRFTWDLFRPVSWLGIGAIILGSLTILASVGLIGTSAYLLSYAALQPSIAALQVAIIGVRFFGIARSALRYAERLASHSVNLRMVGKLRAWFYQQVAAGYPRVLSSHQTGDLLDRALADISVLEQVFIRVMAPPAIAILVTGVTALVLALQQPLLGQAYGLFAVSSGLLVLALSTVIHASRLNEYAADRSRLHTWLTSLVSGSVDIRVNGQPAVFQQRLKDIQSTFTRLQRQAVRTSAGLNALTSLLSGAGMLAVLALAIHLHARQLLDGRLIATAGLLVLASYEAYLPFPLVGQQMALAMQSVRRLMEMSVSPVIETQPAAIDSAERVEHVEFRQITFSYPGEEKPVISNLSLQIKQGERVAIIGASGVGKTTLAQMLLGFWQPASGDILINGSPISRFSPISLRTMIRSTAQDPYFFPGSIRENLLLAKGAASEADLWSALDAAGCSDWLQQLPARLDVEIGERGRTLSQGQRKRLDIARALVSDASLLVLDEPFAGLDPDSARALHRSIQKISDGRAIVIITHVLDYLAEMDRIFVFKDGSVIEDGTHRRLLAAGGEYARMVAIQRGRLDDDPVSTRLY
jgi:thiol reductant ABC exporter CydC subunit